MFDVTVVLGDNNTRVSKLRSLEAYYRGLSHSSWIDECLAIMIVDEEKRVWLDYQRPKYPVFGHYAYLRKYLMRTNEEADGLFFDSLFGHFGAIRSTLLLFRDRNQDDELACSIVESDTNESCFYMRLS